MLESKSEIKSELDRLKQELRACRGRFITIMTKSKEGILIIAKDKTIRFANPAAAAIFGCSAKELTGKEFTWPLETDQTTELDMKTRDGKTVTVEIWGVETEWDGDNASYISLCDITARKLAEEALRESEEKFSRAFMAVPNLLFIATLPYEKYVEVNEAFERTCGYRQKDVFGRTLAEFDIWEQPAERIRAIRVLQEEGRLRNLEMSFRNKSGETFCGLLSAELTDLCGVRCMIGIITDITERKKVEVALQKSEEKFAKAFRYVPSLLIVSSTLKEGRLIEVNEAFEKIFMYKREEVIDRSSLELNLWDDPGDRNIVIQTLREQGEVRDREFRFRARNGRIFTGLYSAAIIEIGGEECMLSVAIDISERKRMEQEIEALYATLAARAAELEVANQELEAFSYTVSHDLRRPLTSIHGFCQVMQHMCTPNLGEDCRGYLQEIYDGTKRMNKLISALLNFSRVSHGELKRDQVDLSGMVRKIEAELRLMEPERRATFLVAEGVTVLGDPQLLRVGLENLLENAWKYTGKREETVIEFGVTEIDGEKAFFVRDNGAGFSMANAKQIFIPFQRLPGVDAFKGHGIGLATVERIIGRHGGRIWAEGEEGKGAVFYFTLQG